MAEQFSQWHDGKATAALEPACPIPLLLLTTLRYLGRGWTFDDLVENTAMSQETIQLFLHAFLDYGSTVLYRCYVRAPTTAEEAAGHMKEFAKASYPGAVGLTDATHIKLEWVFYRHHQAHVGFKMTHTAQTYNITVNHQ